MSLGYVKGKYWVPDERFAVYTQRDSHKNLLKACRLAGFGFECSYSYTARRYTCEVFTIERFSKSAQCYIIKHNNAYDPHPMAAISAALRAYSGCTPLVAVACMEIEAELLAEALAEARKREAVLAKLENALDLLEETITSYKPPCSVCGGSGFSGQGSGYGDVCGHCGGTKTEGPGWYTEPRSADPSDVAAAHWENIQRGVIAYDEDDDL